MQQNPIGNISASRRNVLRAIGIGGLGVGVAACTDTSGSGTSSNDKPAVSGAPPFVIRDTGVKLPQGDVELRWTDSGDQKAKFFNAFFPAYEKKHPNIHVKYDGANWNSIQQVMALGLRNGTAPDVFQLPPSIPVAEAISNRWLGPVEDIVPNWSEVKKRFPAGSFANGVNEFDGKTYGMPFTSSALISSLLLFNADYTKKAGYDLAAKPVSWDEFRAVARKCTKQGNGEYYGFICGLTQSGGLSGPFSRLAQMSGLAGGFDAGNGVSGGIDWRTGEFNYTNDLTIEAVELIMALKADGSVFPGSNSLDQPGARQAMPQGHAAIILQGPWNITQWHEENPDFNLGVNLPPIQDPGKISPLSYGPGGAVPWYHSARSKHREVIGDIFAYMSTRAGQTEWAYHDGCGDPPQFTSVIEQVKLRPMENEALDLGTKYSVIGPEPSVRNPDVSKVYTSYVPISPNCSDTINGLFSGQIKGKIPKIMKDLQDRTEKALEAAITKAKSRGAKVSRDDWVFADWDPTKPYTKLYKEN